MIEATEEDAAEAPVLANPDMELPSLRDVFVVLTVLWLLASLSTATVFAEFPDTFPCYSPPTGEKAVADCSPLREGLFYITLYGPLFVFPVFCGVFLIPLLAAPLQLAIAQQRHDMKVGRRRNQHRLMILFVIVFGLAIWISEALFSTAAPWELRASVLQSDLEKTGAANVYVSGSDFLREHMAILRFDADHESAMATEEVDQSASQIRQIAKERENNLNEQANVFSTTLHLFATDSDNRSKTYYTYRISVAAMTSIFMILFYNILFFSTNYVVMETNFRFKFDTGVKCLVASALISLIWAAMRVIFMNKKLIIFENDNLLGANILIVVVYIIILSQLTILYFRDSGVIKEFIIPLITAVIAGIGIFNFDKAIRIFDIVLGNQTSWLTLFLFAFAILVALLLLFFEIWDRWQDEQ